MINESQEKIIYKSKTPAAVIAGPGTGKTFTIVKKVISLIKNDGLDANRILITSFTKKAARELSTRIITDFNKEGIKSELKDMMIGNFHSLAIDFLEKYPVLDDNFLGQRVIDEQMEIYLIERNMKTYEKIKDFDKYISYKKATAIKGIYEEIINYMLDPEAMAKSSDPRANFAAEVYMTHDRILRTNKLMNFQMILRDFYRLLKDPVRGEEIRNSIDFVIVDEYQDTNLIQQEIAFNLCKDKNIMVFGDDDQSLYSFRGANPRNLTEFSDKFYKAKGYRANYYKLDINYRSDQNIIDKAISFLDPKVFNRKMLRSKDMTKNPNTTVRARAYALNNLVMVIRYLKKYIDLGQIAFLFPSLNHTYVIDLQEHFEKNGIKVLNKKSSQFFQRDEIRGLLYILLELADFEISPQNPEFIYGNEEKSKARYLNFLENIKNDQNLKNIKEFQDFLEKENVDQPITTAIYKALGLDYFRKFLVADEKDLEGARILSNISTFIGLAKDFDEIFAIDFDHSHYQEFILGFLKNLFIANAIEEYQDLDTHKDAINFMTIHQAKGLEFDVVFVSGLYDKPRPNRNNFLIGPNKEDLADVKDFYRKYYTAFTRAKKLLVLLGNSDDYRLKSFASSLAPDSILSSIDFKPATYDTEKKILAYTTDIEVYKSCPLKYRFVRNLSFKNLTPRTASFGTAVHKLAEYSLQRPDDPSLYEFLEKNPFYKKPIDNLRKRAFKIRSIETNYKLDRDFYILQGKVDLSLADGSILDIKTGVFRQEVLEVYSNQLMTYKELMRENGENPPKLYLYFIEEDKLIEVMTNDFDLTEIDKIGKLIDENLVFARTDDKNVCKFCPMKYFCKRN